MTTQTLTTKIKLLKPHTHEEVSFDAGAEIEVDDIDAQWLEDNEIGVRFVEAKVLDPKAKKSEQA
jgi:hypothetical protein